MLELKSPAGSLTSALVAIECGCDNVYVGMKDLNHQRKQVKNLSRDDLRELTGVAKDKGVGVYCTFKSSTFAAEFDQFLGNAEFLSEVGASGIIVADLGLIREVSRRFPNLKILYSVQGACGNSEFAGLLKELGVHRLVVDRNMTIEETGSIRRNTGIEVEMFIFGYQCNSHDSMCYMGDYWSNQPCNVHCAQKVTFVNQPNLEQPKRYLFMKYYSALKYLPLFAQHGIDGLKLEGRQRSSDFTRRVTTTFRAAIDHYRECERTGREYQVDPAWTRELGVAAMHFEITDGFFANEYRRHIIAEPTMRSKTSYVSDMVRVAFTEGGSLNTLKNQLTHHWRRARSVPTLSREKERLRIRGLGDIDALGTKQTPTNE